MALTRLPSFTLLTTDDFTFGNVTVSGNLSANYLIGNGSLLTGLPASYTNSDANAAIDARVTKTFIDNLNVDADTLDGLNSTAFATSAQGNLADTAVQPADLTGYATETYVGTQISNLVDAAPTTLNTLNELAAALGDDANFAVTITNSIGNKLAISDFTSTADTWLGTKTTTNLTEGTNLYFTDTRANTSIDNRVTKSFVDNLSVVANIANTATVAGTVTTNAQPNITSVGTLTSLAVTGNISVGNILTDNLLYANGEPWSLGSGGGGTSLPTQSGNSGKYLTTDGSTLSWGTVAGSSTATSQYVTRTSTGDGSTVAYTVSAGATIDSVIVTLSGIVQTPTTDYSITGTTLTFTTAPPNGIVIQIREIGIPMASGSNSQILFNDAGTVGGTANLTFNKSTGMLTAAKLTATSANLGNVGNLRIAGGNVGEILASLGNGQMAWANIVANGDIIVNGGTGGGGASVTVLDVPPSTPSEGDLWLDSESGELNVFFSDAWASVTESAPQLVSTVDSFVGDSLTTSFTLSTTPSGEAYTLVAIGGILQPRSTYTVSGNVLSTSSAVPSNTPIEVTTLGGFASPIGAASEVLNNAQPNITSTGTLTGLNVNGDVSITGNLTVNNAPPATTGKAIAMAIVFGF